MKLTLAVPLHSGFIRKAIHSTAIRKYSGDNSYLYDFIYSRDYLVCITGAGISTESGIPDYRGKEGSYQKGHKPMVHADFINSESSRKRYWARSMVGWKKFSHASPNLAHLALAALEQTNILKFVISQNVDRLHQKSGSNNVLDLHGRNDRVKCLSCFQMYSRKIIQQQIELLNPTFVQSSNIVNDEQLRADGDAELNITDFSKFTIPCCRKCGGVLKPDVVFFGDSVPAQHVQNAFSQIDNCDGLLIIGTSLEVYSAFRLVDRAHKRNVPIAIINKGITRAERSNIPIYFKSDDNCVEVLKGLINTDITKLASK